MAFEVQLPRPLREKISVSNVGLCGHLQYEIKAAILYCTMFC